MPDSKIEPRHRYVYVLFREDGQTPLYVGIGTRSRWKHHERDAYKNRSHKDRVILNMRANGCVDVPKTKLIEDISFSEAAQIEKDLIFLVRRQPNGPLVNQTDGGEGLFNPSEETRAKMREARKTFRHSASSKAKIAAAALGRKYGPRSDETKAKLRDAVSGFRHTQAAKDKIAAAGKRRKWTEEQRRKFIVSRSGIPMPAHVKDALRKANTGRTPSAETITKLRVAMRGFRHSPVTLEKMRRVQKKSDKSALKARLAKKMTAHWQRMSPEERIARSESIRAGMRRRAQNTEPSDMEIASHPQKRPPPPP